MTAVSITISWTAGFNGGSEQTLWVVYHEEGTIGEHQVEVNTTGVSNGDVVTYKLKVCYYQVIASSIILLLTNTRGHHIMNLFTGVPRYSPKFFKYFGKHGIEKCR